MRRRDFLVVLGSAIVAWPLAARAQQPAMPKIGYLDAYATPARWVEAFRRGLRDLGYVENRTVNIEWRSAAGHPARLPDLAAELAQLQPKVIVAETPGAALAAKNATATIPIVVIMASDAVGLGLASNLARPERNVTGLSTQSAELFGKRLELLMEIVPGLARVGVVGNITSRPARTNYGHLRTAAAALRLQLELFEVKRPEDFETAFKAASERVGGVVVFNNAIVRAHREVIVAAAARYKVPAVYPDAAMTVAGGLLSYAANIPDLHRRAATYVDRILKGARPADLPFQQPTKFELVINLKTAMVLGLKVPPTLIARADTVIE